MLNTRVEEVEEFWTEWSRKFWTVATVLNKNKLGFVKF